METHIVPVGFDYDRLIAPLIRDQFDVDHVILLEGAVGSEANVEYSRRLATKLETDFQNLLGADTERIRLEDVYDYDAAFEQADLLLGPVTPTPAFPLGDKIDDPIQMYLCDLFTVGANLAGVPAISLPAGLSSEGLPLAIQLQAPVLEETRLLFAGAAYQAATDHHQLRPDSTRS